MLKTRLDQLSKSYPRQYWLLMAGMLVNTIGMGFVWPFLNIYLKEELGIPLSVATLLPLMEQCVSLFTTLGAGTVADRFGRKGLMVISLGAVAVIFALMGFANTWWMFAVLMCLRGFFLPLYRVAGDTMVADLITDEERRLPAYSLLRTTNNLGVAIGPVLGGIVASYSYRASFLTAAAAMGVFAVLVYRAMAETMPQRTAAATVLPGTPVPGGYGQIARDYLFLLAVLAFTFNGMGAGLPFQLLGVYGKENFGVSEAQVGLIMMVNAMMVVLFQVAIANFTRRFKPLKVLASGALFYAVGVASITLGTQALHFGLSMAVLTMGELLIAPTFTSFAVNMAPPELRGRYMSVYWVGWSFSRGIGPALAGRVYDSVAPAAIWGMGGAFNLLALVIFAGLIPFYKKGYASQGKNVKTGSCA
jgi:MFS family permease